ncbi:transcriptional regulator [Vibrio sp. 10N.286.49.C2]|uniref:winged helix-turn-helix domain-containing protein n=1 Tax=unclassified Vibrio TaxID=2614977 RepID=UPI000C84E2C7|nr:MULTISPECIES: transcriptional regulator [unclassified Vibrio]PMH29848.1 transcriptional regulator [Vibrio sp. 10N.286.49.C2]PMH49809.1 transcriptional regulator [Vibrio sp. 10N.286.49.B1]PMH83661.1 transcriptional regulator [Vibrio sp. 10N.286.48.B7]
MSNIGTKFILGQRYIFDPNSNSLVDQTNNDEVVRLGSNESRILLLLAERPNEVVTRHELHEFVWRDQGFEVDDSSLTQAISTLRKMLKDPTKSPLFVKTVPKRGYQLISSVERSAPLSSIDLNNINEAPVAELPTELTETQPASTSSQSAITKEPAPKTPPTVWGMLALALLLPVLVLIGTNPAESSFRELAVVDNVRIVTPESHPDVSSWQPKIEQCVVKYIESHTAEKLPEQVIVTGDQGDQIALNFIHTMEHSSENVTMRIFTEQSDLSKVCE